MSKRRRAGIGVALGDASPRIRRADSNEGERLREIAIASKSHWGYDLDRVGDWAASRDFSTAGLTGRQVCVAEVDGRVVGWAGLIAKGEVCWLDDLWVEPSRIGTGIGSRRYRHAAEIGAQLGAARMEWETEPNAIGFYERMGGRYLRDSEPSEWGRVLHVMGAELTSSPRGSLEPFMIRFDAAFEAAPVDEVRGSAGFPRGCPFPRPLFVSQATISKRRKR
jgi:GNAT superfamily N-acetyltransferase